MSGFFMTIEGIEGAGKTTQMEMLADFLRKRGKSPHITREPGATRIGENIRQLLLDPDQQKMCSRTEILLYAADRAQHVEEIIKPALNRGKIIISDRYYDSTLAYQGFGRNLNREMLSKIVNWAVDGCHPDLTLLLDVDPARGLQRARSLSADQLGDRLEREELSFHERVRKGYKALARENEKRFKIIDADKSIEEVQKEIRRVVEERLP